MKEHIPAGNCAICNRKGAYAAMVLPSEGPYAHRYCHRGCLEQHDNAIKYGGVEYD